MLIAKDSSGHYILLDGRYSRQQLKKWQKERTFFCPQCHEPLLLKVGKEKIPHFAHYRQSICSTYQAEPESKEHLQAKMDLYHFFRQFTEVKVEHFLSDIQQIPDLLVQWKGEWLPVEYQKSRISVEQWMKRTENYKERQMRPFWILYPPIKWRKSGLTKVRINQWYHLFFYKRNDRSRATAYSPETRSFIYIERLVHLKSEQFLLRMTPVPLERQTFPFRPSPPMTDREIKRLTQLYIFSRQQYVRHVYRYNREGVQQPVLRYLYEHQRNELPPFIGVPFPGQHLFSEHDVLWQILALEGPWPTDWTARQRKIAYRYIEWVKTSEPIHSNMSEVFSIFQKRFLAKRFQD